MVVKLQLPKPHEGQLKVINSNARWKVLMCGRRWGKTLVAQIISINKMLKGQKIAYVVPKHELGVKFLDEMITMLPIALIKRTNKTQRCIELITGGIITFFSGESLDQFRGLKFHYVIIDEAAIIPELKEMWGKAIRPTLIDYKGGGMFISTPNGKEFFYSLYQKGINEEINYESFHYSSFDNPHISADEIEELKNEIPISTHAQEILAIAAESASNPFGTDNINKNILSKLSTKPTVVYGIDVAKHQDWTVITGLDAEGNMTYFDRFQKGWEETINTIAKLPKHITKVIDKTGVGDVVFDLLLTKTENIIGFQFTEISKRELIKELIIAIEKGNVKYSQLTADEMHVCEYTRTAKGNYKFGAKSGYHDDTVMALALANKYKGIGGISDDGWNIDVC